MTDPARPVPLAVEGDSERHTDRPGAVAAGSGTGFVLDPFQRQAIEALDRGRSVLVAAPTGAGKTVVAEHAVGLALAEGGKAFYTTPIKALSNQKYGDLVARHGSGRVGLLTGDNSINPDADVVVMTTEVLRNMIYAGSHLLEGLRFVVLDEVHYLQDTYRGPVWEEVIIHTDERVQLVCLSATVSNAEEVADWLTTVRGLTSLILETERPVELRNLYLVGDRSSERSHLLPTLVDDRPNPEAERMDDLGRPRGRRSGNGAGHRANRGRSRYFTPRRPEVMELLGERDMLPAIYFIFSRVGCEEAVRACVETGLRLTTPDERARVRAIAEERTTGLTDDDLDILHYDSWLDALESGIASHHAGMVPPFKETVEACFAEGLVKAVFATETLALGINMPARSVVVERLTKFTGERRAFLTPGEYTQITGRAGRRGIDERGYAVVLWSPFVPFDQVAGLAASRSYALRSAFRPTYNMATNLVRRYTPADAHHLLNLSFGQFQADRAVVTVETRIERAEKRAITAREEARCELGDVEEYHKLRSTAGALREGAQPRAANREIEDGLARLAPGDVIELSELPELGEAVDGPLRLAVLSVAYRKKGAIKVRAVDAEANELTIGVTSIDAPPVRLGQLEMPTPYQPNQRAFQHQVADALKRGRMNKRDKAQRAQRTQRARAAGRRGWDYRDQPARPSRQADELSTGDHRDVGADSTAEDHPVAACPKREQHLRALMKAHRAESELARLRRDVQSRSESLARRFDRVLRLLEDWGYLDGWELTERGAVLARTYHESDLLVAEALCSGVLDGLDPATLAAVVSGFTYEHRGPDAPPAPWFPSRQARARWEKIETLHSALERDEQAARLTLTRPPDPGFVVLAHAWASGEPLGEVLADEDLSGGDFVRHIRMLIDLLRQVGEVAPNPQTAKAARQATEALERGVIIASATIDSAAAAGEGGEGGDGGEVGAGGAGGPNDEGHVDDPQG